MKKSINELLNLLFATKKTIGERLREADGTNSISIGQFKALCFIKDNGKPTMKDVADFLGITPPSTTSLMAHFIKNGLIMKAIDRNDKRIIHLKITGKGKKKLADSSKVMADRAGKIFSKLSDQQVRNFKDILKTISNNK